MYTCTIYPAVTCHLIPFTGLTTRVLRVRAKVTVLKPTIPQAFPAAILPLFCMYDGGMSRAGCFVFYISNYRYIQLLNHLIDGLVPCRKMRYSLCLQRLVLLLLLICPDQFVLLLRENPRSWRVQSSFS